VSNRSSSSTSLGTAPLLPLPPLSGLTRPSSPKTRAHDLCWMGWRSGRTARVPGCYTDSTDLAASRSPTGRLQRMEVPVVAVVVWQGSARSMKVVVMALSEAPVVLGVGPLDQWWCTSFVGPPAPQRAGNYRDGALVDVFFSSLLPLIAR
jgi:hypothetical protein